MIATVVACNGRTWLVGLVMAAVACSPRETASAPPQPVASQPVTSQAAPGAPPPSSAPAPGPFTGDAAAATAATSVACPSSVPGATTRVVDGKNDVQVLVTAGDPAAIAKIRSVASRQALMHCMIAMEPPGWLDDDCFGDDATGTHLRCPIMARTSAAGIEDIDGGVKIAMSPIGRSRDGAAPTLAQLRAELHRRAAAYGAVPEPAPLHIPSSGTFSLPDSWLACAADRDCTYVGLGCCDLTAVDHDHAPAARAALEESRRQYCPPKAACVEPSVRCEHGRCVFHAP
jgi:hypothetical protein